MKILLIRIKNLASLQDVTEIDFSREPLCSAGIFAITGVTGAGKSTILDALCLALYALTPRFDKARETGIEVTDVRGSALNQNDPRGILRDGTADGFAEVVFVGIDGEKYRSRWSVRRARGKVAGALQAYSMELRNETTGQPFGGTKTEVLKEIERLAGLNFDQFTRSVLLAQGDFTAFLKATKDEKASLLEKLTGTQIYSHISQLIYRKNKDAEREVQDLLLQKGAISLLTPEEIEGFEQQKSRLEHVIQHLEERANEVKTHLQWHSGLKDLKAKASEAEQHLQQATASRQAAEPRFSRLAQVEKVQDVAVPVNRWQTFRSQLQEEKQKLFRTTSRLHECHQHKRQWQEKKLQADEILLETRAQKNRAAPLLNEASRLDVVAGEKRMRTEEARRKWAEARQKLAEFLARLDEQKKQEEQVRKKYLSCEDWKQQNESRRGIAENQRIISDKLAATEKILRQLREEEHSQKAKAEQEGQLAEKIRRLDESLVASKAGIRATEALIQEKSREQEGIQAAAIQRQWEKEVAHQADVLAADNHWNSWQTERRRLAVIQEKIQDARQKQAGNNQTLLQLEKELYAKKEVQEAAKRLLDRVKLEQSESVESLRDTLEEGEPCAVCGSTSHPYKQQVAEHRLVTAVEAQYNQSALEYERAYTQLVLAEKNREYYRDSIPQMEKELKEAELLEVEMQEKWKQFRVVGELAGLEEKDIAPYLKSAGETTAAKIARLKQELQRGEGLNRELNDLKLKLQSLDKQLSAGENAQKDAEREAQTLRENQERLKTSIAGGNTMILEVQRELEAFFTHKEWFENWQKSPVAFIENIRAFAQKWQENEETLSTVKQQLSALSSRISTLEEQRKQEEQESEEMRHAYEKSKALQEEVENERQKLFGGRAVARVEKELQDQLEAAEAAVQTCNAELEKINTDLAVTQTAETASKKQIEQLTAQIEEQRAAVEDWIAQSGEAAGYEEVLELLEYTSAWRQKERKELAEIEESLKQALTIFEERQQSLESHQHKHPEIQPEEELIALNAQLKTETEAARAESNRIDYEFKRHETDFKRAEKLLGEINKKQEIAENWGALNELIGSADGKKFRQIAQEYTLDLLLEFANQELEMLTKRYSIQRIPGTLGLQVMDHDMGDEVRTVFSLSGGESFLLSLALALGLSSLSSAQMKVESLFIDEGFGALDPETLNIAMDALERLHNQGRKVGVISHVQEMTERIPVQIKVRKVAAGRSVAEVVEG